MADKGTSTVQVEDFCSLRQKDLQHEEEESVNQQCILNNTRSIALKNAQQELHQELSKRGL